MFISLTLERDSSMLAKQTKWRITAQVALVLTHSSAYAWVWLDRHGCSESAKTVLFLAQGIWQELSVIRGTCTTEGLLPFGSQQSSADFRICRAHPTGHFYRPCPDPAGPVTPQILSWPHEAAGLPHRAPGPASQSVRWPRGTDIFVEKAGHSSLLPLLECMPLFSL